MQKILVTTDFSHQSRQLLDQVMAYVAEKKRPIEIILLNTYLVPSTDPKNIIQANDEMKYTSRMGLQCEMERAQKLNHNPQVTFRIASQMGSLKNVLKYFLEHEKPDFVAVARDQHQDIGNVFQFLREKNCSFLELA